MASLCQYCEHPAGYTVADPSMMIAVYMDTETVEALLAYSDYRDRFLGLSWPLRMRQCYAAKLKWLWPNV